MVDVIKAGELNWNLSACAKKDCLDDGLCAIHHLFEEQARQRGGMCAIRTESKDITYSELNEKANQLATRLIQENILPGDIVALFLSDAVMMIASMLAVLKVGAIYLPLDIAYPRARVNYIMDDSGAKLLIADAREPYQLNKEVPQLLLDKIHDQLTHQKSGNLSEQFSADQAMYLIYTSGSTGRPKGVLVKSMSVINLLLDIKKRLNFHIESSLLSVTSWGFDISVLEIWLPLLSGGIHLRPAANIVESVPCLVDFIKTYKPTLMQTTPSRWALLYEELLVNQIKIPVIFVGGEVISRSLVSMLTRISDTAWNVYGPTETTIWSTYKPLDDQRPTSIGHPFANTSVYILNKDMKPVSRGELWIGGAGVSLGYYKPVDQTHHAFIENPFVADFGHNVIFRTGDRVQWLNNGELGYLGRINAEIKHHGYRIDLKQIENLAMDCTFVKDSIAVITRSNTAKNQLLLYTRCQEGECSSFVTQIRLYLADHLPTYMMPDRILIVDTFPLNAHGKLELDKLLDSNQSDCACTHAQQAASNMTIMIASVFKEVCQIRHIDYMDNFFDAGVNSLLIGQVCRNLVSKGLEQLEIMDFFRYPTIDALSRHLMNGHSDSSHLKSIDCAHQPVINALFNIKEVSK